MENYESHTVNVQGPIVTIERVIRRKGTFAKSNGEINE